MLCSHVEFSHLDHPQLVLDPGSYPPEWLYMGHLHSHKYIQRSTTETCMYTIHVCTLHGDTGSMGNESQILKQTSPEIEILH